VSVEEAVRGVVRSPQPRFAFALGRPHRPPDPARPCLRPSGHKADARRRYRLAHVLRMGPVCSRASPIN